LTAVAELKATAHFVYYPETKYNVIQFAFWKKVEWRSTVLHEFFLVFLNTSRLIPGHYTEIDHDSFFIFHNLLIILYFNVLNSTKNVDK